MKYTAYFLTEPNETKLMCEKPTDADALVWFRLIVTNVRHKHPRICNGWLFAPNGRLVMHWQRTDYCLSLFGG